MEQTQQRQVWIDWLRVAACFMVMVVHCTEPFYLGGDGSLILSRSDGFWAAFSDSFVRACVPLFVVASSYLLFPLKTDAGTFFKRRAVRILLPFVIWSLIYALVWGNPAENLRNLAFNFNYSAGHLWFVYMLIGLYLLMPLLSPWAEKVGKKELLAYMGLCFASSLLPLLRDWLGNGSLAITYGPSGIPRQALYPLWGEASWNAYGLFYYFSGFIGYLLLGLYLRRFAGELSWKKTLAISLPCWLAGFAIVFGGFWRRINMGEGFPAAGAVDSAVWWETTWCNDTVGVVLMTIAWILLFKKIKSSGAFYRKIILPLSKAGYGMYLSHMLVLAPVSAWFRNLLGAASGNELLGFWTAPASILLGSLATFAITGLVSVLIRKIPKVGPWIMG
ncbi:MAG: acyltransferase [Candidatus Cryptobacteroides sp.]